MEYAVITRFFRYQCKEIRFLGSVGGELGMTDDIIFLALIDVTWASEGALVEGANAVYLPLRFIHSIQRIGKVVNNDDSGSD